jgi:hypothetical protein
MTWKDGETNRHGLNEAATNIIHIRRHTFQLIQWNKRG